MGAVVLAGAGILAGGQAEAQTSARAPAHQETRTLSASEMTDYAGTFIGEMRQHLMRETRERRSMIDLHRLQSYHPVSRQLETINASMEGAPIVLGDAQHLYLLSAVHTDARFGTEQAIADDVRVLRTESAPTGIVSRHVVIDTDFSAGMRTNVMEAIQQLVERSGVSFQMVREENPTFTGPSSDASPSISQRARLEGKTLAVAVHFTQFESQRVDPDSQEGTFNPQLTRVHLEADILVMPPAETSSVAH